MRRYLIRVNSKDSDDDFEFLDDITKRQLEGKLFRAIAEEKFKLARILVEGGINVNCSLRTGVTPLILTCDQAIDGEHKRMQLHLVRCLLRRGADVNAKDNFGRTALTYAFLNGDLQLVRILELNGSSAWATQDVNVNFYRKARDSVIITSSLGMHFHRWASDDFADNIR